MIGKVIEYCARNRILVLALTACAVAVGVFAVRHIPLDAIPDLSDTQVIITSRWDRSPDIIEDQVTYPIVTAMLGAPRVKAVRGFSDFGQSYVYVIFRDGTDIYWARSRTMEYLASVLPNLPEGVRTQLGPDATSVGWVFQYALVDDSARLNLAQLRSLQDWFLRYQLQSVPGVAEVASIGGFVKQYQVQVDPAALIPYRISISDVTSAIRRNNHDMGAGLIEFSGTEYMVRGRGYLRSKEDIENIFLTYGPVQKSILVRDVAKVRVGSDSRRGVGDLDGLGDAVGGIVVMRHGENALRVTERVREKLKALAPSLPPGVRIVTTYDRSDLIQRAIETLRNTLFQEMLVVSLVILFFLRHIASALVPILTIPVSVVLAFIPLYWLGLSSNIMSLSGIAISIGVLVDGAIVEMENAYKKLGLWIEGGRKGDYHSVRLDALKEVGPSVFFALLVISVAFLPIFALLDEEGRLFKPLAWSKTLTMLVAAILTVTLDPALRTLFTRVDPVHFRPEWLSRAFNAVAVGEYRPEREDRVSRGMFKIYGPAVDWILEHPLKTLALAGLAVLLTVPVYFRLGTEFLPPLNEGTVLYMPTTLPGISIREAQRVLQIQNRILKGFPEVERVYGKAGRADTSTDPAPLSMIETLVMLRPKEEWRTVRALGFWPRRITYDELISEMDHALRLPGVPNIWTQPIRNRIDMLSTGIRTPVGVKILGPDLAVIQKLGAEVESALREVPGTRNVTAERTGTGYFVDFSLRRRDLAKFGLSVDDMLEVMRTAIGGRNVTATVEGRERYPVNVRYAPDFRDDLEKLKRAAVMTELGIQRTLGELADLRIVSGPAMIRNENGLLAGFVHVDLAGRDPGSYVEEAKKKVAEKVVLPAGYTLLFAGQYENMARVRERLKAVVPLTLFLILLLLYMNTGSGAATGIVLLAVPFSAVGALWLLYVLGYHMSVAVWVGIIALLGLDAETGIFMLLYLQIAYKARLASGKMRNLEDLKEAVREGAVGRVRPKTMTVACALIGLLPIMWSTGAGADMMKRIAAPMVGGVLSSFLMELLVYPAIFFLWKGRDLKPQEARLVFTGPPGG